MPFEPVLSHHHAMGLARILAVWSIALGGITACDSAQRERERKQAKFEEMTEVDRFNRLLVPGAPVDRTVGCDFCPVLCMTMDPIPMADVLHSFREHATPSAREAEVYPRLRHLGCIAVSMGPEGERAFSTLFDDEVEAVRYFAARLALDLGMDMDRPMRILRAVGRGDSRFAWPARVRLVLLDQTGR